MPNRVDIQNSINVRNQGTSVDLSAEPVRAANKNLENGAPTEIDFRSLLQNSNATMVQNRAAQKSGDLSSAKTDEEFYKLLSERAQPTRTPKSSMGKDDFLKLFIAQLKNQDPLNPKDNSEMAAQLAQFNGLEQMLNVNKNLESMIKNQTTDRTLGLVGYVGKEVTTGNGVLKFDGKALSPARFSTNVPLGEASLEIRDGGGHILQAVPLGNIPVGEQELKWDGKLKDGQQMTAGIYHFAVVGRTPEGENASAAITARLKVSGIDFKDENGALFTDVGKVNLKDISSIGEVGFGNVPAQKPENNKSDTVKPANGQTEQNKTEVNKAEAAQPGPAKQEGKDLAKENAPKENPPAAAAGVPPKENSAEKNIDLNKIPIELVTGNEPESKSIDWAIGPKNPHVR